MVLGIGEGKLDIKINNYNFKYGETIKGQVFLELNQPKKAKQLRIVLTAERKQYSGKSTKTITVHRVFISLDGEKEYRTSTYNFEIKIPAYEEKQLPEGLLGDITKAISALSNTSLRWYLDASLDIPMSMDVSKKIEINVSK